MPPAAAAVAAGGAAAGGQQQQQGGVSTFLQAVLRMGMMWYMFNMFKGGGQQTAGTGAASGGMLRPLYARGDLVDLRMFLYERPYLHDFAKGTLVWELPGVALGTTPEHKHTYSYRPSKVRAGRRGPMFVRLL
jgi:hypothetical protein